MSLIDSSPAAALSQEQEEGHNLKLELVQVTDDLLTEVALACPLRRLAVSNCSTVTDRGVRGVAAGAPHLTELSADDVGRFTDAALVALSESCRDIQVRNERGSSLCVAF